MSSASNDNLLARLAGQGGETEGDPWAAVAASLPRHESIEGRRPTNPQEESLNKLLGRIRGVAGQEPAAGADAGVNDAGFLPLEPE